MAVHLHTRYVKILRLVLPALAVISLAGLLVWPFWREHRQNDRAARELAAQDAATADTTPQNAPLQVVKPDYQGLDHEGRPYHITAARVEQNLDPKAPINLIEPAASLIMRAATADRPEHGFTLQARHGLYDATAQTLDLKGAVTLRDNNGYVMTMQDLVVDLDRFYAMTTTPVTGHGPQGSMSAQSLNIADKGAVIVLKGPSRLVFQPGAAGSVLPQPALTPLAVIPPAATPSDIAVPAAPDARPHLTPVEP